MSRLLQTTIASRHAVKARSLLGNIKKQTKTKTFPAVGGQPILKSMTDD